MMGKRKKGDGLAGLVRLIGLVLTAIAIYQELRKPPAERTWNGKVADFVPYDFRAPTLERVKSRLWNPEDPTIIMPTVFGVGWTVNLPSAYRYLKELYEQYAVPAQ
jgi:hypothetical protein